MEGAQKGIVNFLVALAIVGSVYYIGNYLCKCINNLFLNASDTKLVRHRYNTYFYLYICITLLISIMVSK